MVGGITIAGEANNSVTGQRRVVLVDGKSSNFLYRSDLWHAAGDVSAWRTLVHFALLRRWMDEYCSDATGTEASSYAAASTLAADLLQSKKVVAAHTWCVSS